MLRLLPYLRQEFLLQFQAQVPFQWYPPSEQPLLQKWQQMKPSSPSQLQLQRGQQ